MDTPRIFAALLSALALHHPSSGLAQTTLQLLGLTNTVWRYNQSDNLDGVNWFSTNFNDASWPSGRSLLAFESDSSITPLIGTVLASPQLPMHGVAGHAYYFRTSFNLPAGATSSVLTFSSRIDDGAIIYLNGIEVGRVRLPAEPLSYSTFATGFPASGDATLEDSLTVSNAPLVPGTNLLAVAVHQQSGSSSDVVWGLALAVTLHLPAVTQPPADLTGVCGGTGGFTVAASGSDPLTYRWHKNGVALNNDSRVSGALSSSLVIHDLRSTDDGDYSVVVSNVAGVVTSPPARLTVDASSCAPNAWMIGANGGLLAYYTNLTAGQKAAAFDNGWRLTVFGRLMEDSISSRSMMMALGNGTRRFGVWWDMTSSGNLTAQLDGTGIIQLTQGGVGARDYHTHELEYDPVTSRATYRFDGKAVASWLGQLLASQNGQVYWGAAMNRSSGRMDFHRVTFEITRVGLVANYEAGTQATLPAAPSPVTQGWSRDPSQSRSKSEGPAASVNDRFADRLLLTGARASGFGVNVDASAEAGEPAHAGTVATRSLWWSWTAPFTGGAHVTTAGSSFDTVLSVYAGNALANLATVTSASRSNAADYVTFPATALTTYQIAVDGRNGSGEIALSIELEPAPAHDNFATPRTLTGGNVTDMGSTPGATKEPGEPYHAGNAGGRSVWYQWTAPASGCVVVETTGSDFDTLLGVYVGGSLFRMTAIATNDDSGSQLTSGVQFNAVAGATYRIVVDGYDGVAGQVVLRLTLSGAPPGPFSPANDQFAQRLLLVGTNISTVGSTLTATREPGEPLHGGNACGKSAWWQWTAPFSGGVTLSLGESDFPAVAGVYSGSSLGSLTAIPVARPDETRAIFKAVAGVNYQIAVESALGGTFRLALELWPSPPNDNFPSPASAPLSNNVVLLGTNLGATTEPGEPPLRMFPASSGHSVWWKWRASTAAMINVRSDGTSFPHILGIFTGANVSNLTLVGTSELGQITFATVQAQTYYLCIDGLDGAAGSIRLTLGNLGGPANDLFSSRFVLAGSNTVMRASNTGATVEAGEPAHVGITGGKSVWWQWSTAQSGRLFLSTYGSTFDTLLAVYDGPDLQPQVSSLTPLAGNDNYRTLITDPFPGSSFVALDYVPRVFPQLQRLYFAVDGKSGASGGITLAVTFVPRPANDNFSSRLALNGSYSTGSGSVVAATRETGEPPLLGSIVARTVWYSWTAPSHSGISRGAVTLRFSGANFVPTVGIFQGGALNALIAVPLAHQTNAWTRTTTFEAVPGETYQIAVGGDPAIDRPGGTFVERATLASPGTLVEVGSFSLTLEFATLALRFSNLLESLEFFEFPRKLRFSALAEIANYGTGRSRPVRVRLVAVPTSIDLPVLELGNFVPSPSDVGPGESIWVAVNGASPVAGGFGLLFGVRRSVYALLEEYLDGEWLSVTANLLLVVLPTGVSGTAGGVIIADPPLRGTDNCRWNLTSVEVVAPSFFVEGSTNALSFRVRRQDSCSGSVLTSVLTNAPWTCNLAGCHISTNGILVIPRGAIAANDQIALSFDYEFRGVARAARVSVPVYNREPVLTRPGRLADGRFRFTINGPPNTICLIETSTNLSAWFSLPNSLSTDGSGTTIFTDSPPGLKQRFYRTRER